MKWGMAICKKKSFWLLIVLVYLIRLLLSAARLIIQGGGTDIALLFPAMARSLPAMLPFFLLLHLIAFLLTAPFFIVSHSIRHGEKNIPYKEIFAASFAIAVLLALAVQIFLAQQFDLLFLLLLIYSLSLNIKYGKVYRKTPECHTPQVRRKLAAGIVLSLLINLVFAFQILVNSQIWSVIGHESFITGIHYTYNEDGSLRYRRDGSLDLDTDWGRRNVYGYRINYSLFLYPAASIGLWAFLRPVPPQPSSKDQD